MRTSEIQSLVTQMRRHSGWSMQSEQLVLQPVVDAAHQRTRLGVGFAASLAADDGPHTVNICLSYVDGDADILLACGNTYLEGLELGHRVRRARAVVLSSALRPRDSFASDSTVERLAAERLSVLMRIERTQPQLGSLIESNFATYPVSAYCAHTSHGFTSTAPCLHLEHALATLRDTRPGFLNSMERRFVDVFAHYTGDGPRERNLFVDNEFRVG